MTYYYNGLQFGLLLFNYNNPTPSRLIFCQPNDSSSKPLPQYTQSGHSSSWYTEKALLFNPFHLVHVFRNTCWYMLIHKRGWWHFLEIEGKTEAHRNAFLYVVEFVESIFLETGGLDWWFGVWWQGIVAFRFFCVQLKKQTPNFGYVNWKEHMIKKSNDIQLIFPWNKIHTDFTSQHDPDS